MSIALSTFGFIDFSWTATFKNWIVALVNNYPNWTAAIVFVLAFGESLAFVSLVFPFWAILFLGIGPLLVARVRCTSGPSPRPLPSAPRSATGCPTGSAITTMTDPAHVAAQEPSASDRAG